MTLLPRLFLWPLFAAAVLLQSSCSEQGHVSPQIEMEASAGTTEWLRSRYGFYNDPEWNELLNRVTARLAQGAYSLRTWNTENLEGIPVGYPWQVHVIRSNEPNAFAIGGGTIILTRGLLAYAANEAELAAVISHEMAHQILGHSNHAIYRFGTAKENSPSYQHSLQDELAADGFGIQILQASRYDISTALQAISIAYRPVNRFVPLENPEWLSARTSHLLQQIQAQGPNHPATKESREHTKLRNKLLGIG